MVWFHRLSIISVWIKVKKNDYQLPKMCLSFANLKEKGKYNGCNWEVVTLEVVQTCTFVPKRPSTWKAGRRARVLYFCSRLFLRSGPLVTARVEEVKLLLSAEALAGRYTKDTCSRLLTVGVTSPAWTCGEQSEASAAESWRSIFSRRLPVTIHFSRRNRGSHRAHWGQTSCYPRDLK